MARSVFTFFTNGLFVLVEDQNKGMSVTNDAGNVIADISRTVDLSDKRILYRDSEGRWDELLVQDGKFAGFRSIGAYGSWRDVIYMLSQKGAL